MAMVCSYSFMVSLWSLDIVINKINKVTYSAETLTLTAKDENNLRIFESANIEEYIWSC